MPKSVWLIAAATIVLHLACINEYGAFRDELYYLACGEHLDWGYVDQPPLVALIAWFTRALFGDSLLAIRIFPVLANAGIVLLTAAIARRLGGSAFAQTFAALCAAIAPIYLALGHFLSMNIFEPLFWMGMVYVAIRIFQGGDERLWLLFGALAGLGLQNKHTTLWFGAAFVIGLLLTQHRRVFLRPWIWLGGLVAFVIFLPNLIWQVRHDFATLELLRNIADSNKNEPVTLFSFFTGQILLAHPFGLFVWIAGVIWLLRSQTFRALGWCFLALFALFVAMEGKVYYIAPIYPMLFAAGAMVVDRLPRWGKAIAVAIFIIGGALTAPLVVPILDEETYVAYEQRLGIKPPKTETAALGELPQHFADMHGWKEMAQATANAFNRLTPEEKKKCAIFGQNYGQAAAIDFYGPALGLPKAISGHQNYYLWGPRGATGEVMIVLDDDAPRLRELFTHVEEAGVFRAPYVMPYENDRPIHICRGLKMPMSELWPQIKKWI